MPPKAAAISRFRIEHIEANGTVWPYECEASNRPPLLLHRLIEHTVTNLKREDLRLSLHFDDGSALRVYSALDGLEAGSITFDGVDEFIEAGLIRYDGVKGIIF